MDFFAKASNPDTTNSLVYLPVENEEVLPMSVQDSITSLMNMADKMEALLPPEFPIDLNTEQLSDDEPSANAHPSAYPQHSLHEVTLLPSVKSETTVLSNSLDRMSSVTIDPVIDIGHSCLPSSTMVPIPVTNGTTPPAIITALGCGTSSLSTSVTISASAPSVPTIPSDLTHPISLAPMCVPAMPVPATIPLPTPTVSDISAPCSSVPFTPTSAPVSVSALLPTATSPPTSVPTSALTSSPFPTPAIHSMPKCGNGSSPVAIRDLPAQSTRVTKPRKTPRKPKTYSKPVASRFCHICSRMPRRGQGSATCRRMAEGFCRKIVCEQCLREQGWDYESIMADPGSWLCPHCADVCPARSQCHIYNRINARRKRTGSGSSQKQTASVAAALATSEMMLGQYGHLLNESQAGLTQILQPPPNFRLNLPPQYTQL